MRRRGEWRELGYDIGEEGKYGGRKGEGRGREERRGKRRGSD